MDLKKIDENNTMKTCLTTLALLLSTSYFSTTLADNLTCPSIPLVNQILHSSGPSGLDNFTVNGFANPWHLSHTTPSLTQTDVVTGLVIVWIPARIAAHQLGNIACAYYRVKQDGTHYSDPEFLLFTRVVGSYTGSNFGFNGQYVDACGGSQTSPVSHCEFTQKSL